MSKCLVTGHKGYIGSRLYNELEELGHEVRGIDLLEEEDILDGLEHLEDFAPEYIFHLACIPRVAYSVEQPVYTAINNIISTSIVLDFAKKVKAKRVVYSGSSSVIGNGDGPTSPYALQKLTSELETKLYASLYGIDTITLRYFNVYSEDQEATGPYATAVSNWMHFIRNGKNPFITGDGTQRRDMLYVHDAVSANIFAMEFKGQFEGKTFDTGTGDNVSLNEMKEIVLEYQPDVEFDYIDPRPGDVMITKANTNSLAELGWKVKMPIEKGIRKCFGGLK
jgi:UDP-glucose 4-epimerase